MFYSPLISLWSLTTQFCVFIEGLVGHGQEAYSPYIDNTGTQYVLENILSRFVR